MSFANSHTEWLEWCVVVHFPTNPPVSTTIYVHESGNIPILLSLPQMMNLGFQLALEPDAIYLTCKLLGNSQERLPFSHSRHAVVDLARVKGKLTTAKETFATVEESSAESAANKQTSVSSFGDHCEDENEEDDDETTDDEQTDRTALGSTFNGDDIEAALVAQDYPY